MLGALDEALRIAAVPRALSVLLSYDAHRRMTTSFERDARNTPEARERRNPLLTLNRSRGRLTGMPVVGLMYPAMVLCDALDMLPFSSPPPAPDVVKEQLRRHFQDLLTPLLAGAPSSGPEDESWYWAAPLLLDRQAYPVETAAWFDNTAELAAVWATSDEESGGSAFKEHLDEARRMAIGESHPEWRPPADLPEVLALLAMAGPGVCALRAVARVTNTRASRYEPVIRQGAARIAWALRSLFNVPEVISLLRGIDAREPYWRRVLDYAAHGCLQSVLDDYAHVLVESLGLFGKDAVTVAAGVAAAAAEAIGMRAATPGVDEITVDTQSGRVGITSQRARARFAMRFGQERADARNETHFRADQVRKAFNSPFWPFVLVTTSIGQEGLDFHPYCHAVVHWNLPGNPVDLEQREGRVHRYKGHAVRKNLARVHGGALEELPGHCDPWDRLFTLALGDAQRGSDLNPFWVYPVEGGAVIERHVPVLPLSRESVRLPALRRSLAVYRMVFGQPRQDDLVAYLLENLAPEELESALERARIDLSP